jgi:amino acid adenylation domain-containing protein
MPAMEHATLLSLLSQGVREHGSLPAAECADATASYSELWERASSLRTAIRAAGAGDGDRVGIVAGVSLAATVSVWACIRAGVVYVPIELEGPAAWIRSRISRAELSAIVVVEDRVGALSELRSPGSAVPFIVVDESGRIIASDPPVRASARPDRDAGVRAEDPAMILYTSGSTDEPKGVVHTHASVMAVIEWARTALQLRAGDRVLANGPLFTDIAFSYLYLPALAGSTVVYPHRDELVFPARFGVALADRRITVVFATPTMLRGVVGPALSIAMPELRVVVFGGEMFPIDDLRAFARCAPNAVLVNVYGTSETGMCAAQIVDAAVLSRAAPAPIGRPIAGAELAVVDPDAAPDPNGRRGELWVAGPPVTTGYWRDVARTEAAWGHLVGSTARFYRTGDLVDVDADGCLRYAGRLDDQIKRDGRVVSMRDIEGSLPRGDGIRACAAVPITDAGSPSVALFVEADADRSDAIWRQIRQLLPGYLVPDRLHVVASLPVTAAGKVDRQRLVEWARA